MRCIVPVLVTVLAGCVYEEQVGEGVSESQPLPGAFATTRWAIALGGPFNDEVISVAMDPSGDVLAGGCFAHQADFGSGIVTSPHPVTVGGYYLATGYVSKRSGSDGSELWTRFVDGAYLGQVNAVAVDASGNVYAAGVVADDSGSVDGDPEKDMILLAYDASGTLLWQRGLGMDSNASVRALAVSPGGTVFVSGSYHGTVDFGAGALPVGASRRYGFIAAYTADGDVLWGKSTRNSALSSIAVTPDGGMVGTGAIDGDVVIDGSPFDPSGARAWYARFAADGSMLWAKAVTPVLAERVFPGGVVVDADGQVFLSFDESTGPVPFAQYATIAAIDDAGDSTVVSMQSKVHTRSIAIAPDGQVVYGGFVNSITPIDLGSGPMEGTMFLSAMDAVAGPAGAMVYGDREAPGVTDSFNTMAASPAGLVAGGGFDLTIDFGTGPVTAHAAATAALPGQEHDGLVVMFDWVP